jgi:hypothetical protein
MMFWCATNLYLVLISWIQFGLDPQKDAVVLIQWGVANAVSFASGTACVQYCENQLTVKAQELLLLALSLLPVLLRETVL